MSDDAKLGLVAGVLAVVGVAAFAVPRDGHTAPKPEMTINNSTTIMPPKEQPAAVSVSLTR